MRNSSQEEQIARLAAEGVSNREVGQRLYLSDRTVGSHLCRIFPKPLLRAAGEDGLRAGSSLLDEHLGLALHVARNAADKVRPRGTLLFVSGTGARRPGVGLTLASAVTAALPALKAGLALELAPVRVNLIAPGFVDTPLSASLLGDQLEARRAQLRATLPIGRVVGPADVAAIAVHVMANTALTGGTYDIDGGQQLVAREA